MLFNIALLAGGFFHLSFFGGEWGRGGQLSILLVILYIYYIYIYINNCTTPLGSYFY